MITQAGRPWKLRTRTVSVTKTSHDIVASHDCGAGGRDAMTITEVPDCPPRARVSGTGHQDPPSAFAHPGPPKRPAPANAATVRRSDRSERAHRCTLCRQLIKDGEPFWAIDHDLQRWAQHDDCP